MTDQADTLTRFIQAARESYLSDVWLAAAAVGLPSTPHAHWEVVVRPSLMSITERTDTLAKCLAAIKSCHIRSIRWGLAFGSDQKNYQQYGQDWVGETITEASLVECWKFSQHGVFIRMFPIHDDLQSSEVGSVRLPRLPLTLPADFVPEHMLDVDVAISTIAHVFRFADRLAMNAFAADDGEVVITIRLTGTQDRILVSMPDGWRPKACYRAIESTLENTWRCPREELHRAPENFAGKAALWLFEQFSCHELSAEALSAIQTRGRTKR